MAGVPSGPGAPDARRGVAATQRGNARTGRRTQRGTARTSRLSSRAEHGGKAHTYRLHSTRPGGELGIGDPHPSWSEAVSELPAEHFDFWPGLTPFEQLDAVNSMRLEVKASGVVGAVEACDPCTLHRFLRARNFDQHKACQMYLANVIWRRDHAVDGILDTFHYGEEHEVLKVFPQGYYKTDRQGRPVYYQFLSGVNMDRLRQVTTEERWLRFQVFEYEKTLLRRFPACSRAHARFVDQTCVVLNVDGVSTRQFGGEIRTILARISSVSQDYYPEMLGKMFIINAPFAFRAIWAIVRPMLNERTKAKIEVLGADCTEKLIAAIPSANLPEIFGGDDMVSAEKLPWEWLASDVGPWAVEAPDGSEGSENGNREPAALAATPLPGIAESPSASVISASGWTPMKNSLLERIKELEARVEALERSCAGAPLPDIEDDVGPTGVALLTPAPRERPMNAPTAVAGIAGCGGMCLVM